MAENWRHRVACKDVDPELFHVDRRRKDWRERADAAKAVCARCPVSHRCLIDAVEYGDEILIRAGLEPDERKGMAPMEVGV